MPRAAAIYTRISDDRLGDAAGVARQQADCMALAKQKGWTVASIYSDNDISAYSGKARPEYKRLLADIKGRRIDAVVVWHLDRLHRSPRELEDFFAIVDEAGVTHLATVTGDISLGTHEGRLQARLLGSVARFESDHKSDRIKRKHEEIAAAGRVSGGGDRPFGFEVDRVTLRDAEAKAIRDAAKRVLAGESLRGVTLRLNTSGSVTSTGRQWYPSALRRVLMSARIGGRREHHKRIVGPAIWPSIIEPAQSDRLRAVLGDPRRKAVRPARRYLLAGGLALCALCEHRLVARPKADGRRCYVCASGPGFDGCGKIRCLAEPLEDLVVDALLDALDGPGLARAIARDKKAATRGSSSDRSLADDEAQLAQLATDFADRRISRLEWLAARDVIEERMDEARALLATQRRAVAVTKYVGRATSLRRTWTRLELDQKRAILASVLDHVSVSPAVQGRNFFDPARVGLVWRF